MSEFSLGYYRRLLPKVGKAVALEALNIVIARSRKKVVRAIQVRGPKTPWLTKRLWQKHQERRVRTLAVDSVQSRESNLPPRGLIGVTGRRVLVYHEADKAGPHIEAYLEVQNPETGKVIAYNIGVKRLTGTRLADANPSRNADGWLTEAAKGRLVGVWKNEFQLGKNAWLGQSTDHMPEEARWSWSTFEESPKGYGAGNLRQVLADDPVPISTLGENSVEWRDPLIDPRHEAYCFKVMDQKPGVRPRSILGLGLKKNVAAPDFDKLHLKLRKDPTRFLKHVGEDGIVTIKEDGASFYFRIDRHGARFWSPRYSRVTGERIEYTSKFRDWRGVTSDVPIEGMGEFEVLDEQGVSLPAASVGGLLNQNRPIDEHLSLKGTLYRVDKVGRADVTSEAYTDQLSRIHMLAAKHPDWHSPTIVTNTLEAIEQVADSTEGCVGVPAGKSIIEAGLKLKVRGDTYDWKVDRIELERGPKGDVAGVVHFLSLTSGREYKMGGGPLGTRELREAMLAKPEEYVDRVYKVACFDGHEGRAAHIVEEHADKGAA